jgi:hypothetical protein
MKINKLTSALVALGFLSLTGVAQANPVIYITGSTAFRQVIYSAMKASGNFIFTNAATVVSPTDANSANNIVYEGVANIGGTYTTIDLDCTWTGSEAGIAAVAGQGLNQTINNSVAAAAFSVPASKPLPGVPPTFYTAASGWTTLQALPINGGVSTPDLTMADTSQAVSQTPKATYNLVDYGVVGIIPFTFAKGYNSTPTSPAAWAHLTNVTASAINQNLSVGDLYDANHYTGIIGDTNYGVAIVGRNLGSGTRANFLLNAAQYGLNTPVIQQGFDCTYTTAGVLTFNGVYTSGQTMQYYGNDGFDSGGNVAKELNVNGSGSFDVIIGYVGIPDAVTAMTNTPSGGGAATPLTFNGFYESDANIINGNYSYWGQEHLLGSIGQSPTSNAGYFAADIVSGLATYLASNHLGTATGDFSTLGAGPMGSGSGQLGQSWCIPKALMNVHRTADYGFPIQGGF